MSSYKQFSFDKFVEISKITLKSLQVYTFKNPKNLNYMSIIRG